MHLSLSDIHSATIKPHQFKQGRNVLHQRAVYAILKKARSMKSGDLYTEYFRSVKKPVVDRAYRKHMERMEELGLVRSSGSGRWKRYEVV